MAGKLMYIPNGNKQNCPFYKLQLVVEMFGHSTNKPTNQIQKSQKLLCLQIRKNYYKTLWTRIINSPLFPPSLLKYTHRK